MKMYDKQNHWDLKINTDWKIFLHMQTEKIQILKEEVLSDNWYTLKKFTYEYPKKDGSAQVQMREVYDRGNGATILLYNPQKQTWVSTRPFRLPTFYNAQ